MKSTRSSPASSNCDVSIEDLDILKHGGEDVGLGMTFRNLLHPGMLLLMNLFVRKSKSMTLHLHSMIYSVIRL